MSAQSGASYLTSLLNKTLRVTTTDTRMFMGRFRCTDSDRNIILTSAFEFRAPAADGAQPEPRFLGQVVVPGEWVEKIEVDEFRSQMRN